MTEAALSGLLNGSIAALICALYREYRLLNLAASAWVCLGGWLGAAILGQLGPSASHYSVFLAIVFVCFLGSFQVIAIVTLRERLFDHPTLYLFIALAIHVILVAVGGNVIPVSRGSVLPLTPEADEFFMLPGFQLTVLALGLVGASAAFLRSRGFAVRTIAFRITPQSIPNWRYVACVQAVQLLLLVLLGAVAKDVHKGHFAAMNLLMVTTVLSAIAAKGRPVMAFAWGFGLAVCELLLRHVPSLAGVAVPTVLLAFVVVILGKERPFPKVAFFPANKWLNSLSQPDGTTVRENAFMALTLLGATFAWQALLRWSDCRLVEVSLAIGYGLLAYAGIRYCGIVTASLPVLGGSLIYAVVHLGSSPSVWGLGVLLGLFAVAVLYLFVLRGVPLALAILIDLSVIVALHQIISGSAMLSGIENTLPFARTLALGVGPDSGPYVLWILSFIILCSLAWIHTSSRGRLFAHSISDVFHASRNGLWPRGMILIASTAIILLSVCLRWVEVAAKGSIAPESVDPMFGIMCLFFGYVMASGNPLRGFLLCSLLIGVLPDLLHIQGEWRDAWLGVLVAFVIIREARNSKYATT